MAKNYPCGSLAADRSDEIAHVLDEPTEPLERARVLRLALDLGHAIGNGKGTDASRRSFETMCQKKTAPDIRCRDFIPHGQGLLDEHGQHFTLHFAIAHGLLREVDKVHWPTRRATTGLPSRH